MLLLGRVRGLLYCALSGADFVSYNSTLEAPAPPDRFPGLRGWLCNPPLLLATPKITRFCHLSMKVEISQAMVPMSEQARIADALEQIA